MNLGKNKIAAYLAQLLGSGILFSIILLSFVFIRGLEAFTIGIGIAVLIYAFQKFTMPHFNPVISLGALINKRMSVVDFVVYLFMQLLGVLFAFPLVAWIRNEFIELQLVKNGGLGVEGLREQIASQLPIIATYSDKFEGLAFIVEALMAFLLVFVFLSATDKDNNRSLSGAKVGAITFVITALASQVTGASFHPFRALVPALFNGAATFGETVQTTLNYLSVYLAAPLFGGLLGGGAYALFNWLSNSEKRTVKTTVIKSDAKVEKPVKSELKAKAVKKAKPARKAAKKTTSRAKK